MKLKELLGNTLEINGVHVSFTEDNSPKIKITDDINEDNLLYVLKEVFDYEIQEDKPKNEKAILLDLKGLDTDLLISAFRYSLTREDLKDLFMILNIINLIKVSANTLSDSYFEDPNIYITDVEMLVDVKLELGNELNELTKKISIYFLSLIKSYNKVMYTQQDHHVKLPNLYSAIFLSSDFLSLAGIFSSSQPFNTNECMFIEEPFKYISSLLTKNLTSISLMDDFFKSYNNKNKSMLSKLVGLFKKD